LEWWPVASGSGFDGGPSVFQQLGSWFSAIGFGPTVSGATLVAIVVYLVLYVL
jgi:hypothetical protein